MASNTSAGISFIAADNWLVRIAFCLLRAPICAESVSITSFASAATVISVCLSWLSPIGDWWGYRVDELFTRGLDFRGVFGEKTSKHKHWFPFGKETNSEHFDARSSQHNSEIESRILSSVTRSLYSSVSSGQGAMEEDTSYDTEIKLLQPYISVYVWRRTA